MHMHGEYVSTVAVLLMVRIVHRTWIELVNLSTLRNIKLSFIYIFFGLVDGFNLDVALRMIWGWRNAS